jgi:bifunctional non-homologous end joining protein LigD
LDATADALITAAKENGLEGLLAKDMKSPYQSGERTGAWAKYKINQGQELVIGGYLPGKPTFDALLVGYYAMTSSCSWARFAMALCPA